MSSDQQPPLGKHSKIYTPKAADKTLVKQKSAPGAQGMLQLIPKDDHSLSLLFSSLSSTGNLPIADVPRSLLSRLGGQIGLQVPVCIDWRKEGEKCSFQPNSSMALDPCSERKNKRDTYLPEAPNGDYEMGQLFVLLSLETEIPPPEVKANNEKIQVQELKFSLSLPPNSISNFKSSFLLQKEIFWPLK